MGPCPQGNICCLGFVGEKIGINIDICSNIAKPCLSFINAKLREVVSSYV